MSSSPTQSRLSNLAAHFASPATAMTSRPPITCHVLDTLSGTPAPSIQVRLTLLSDSTASPSHGAQKPDASFAGLTNSDGRVTAWTASSSKSLEQAFADVEGDMLWAIEFQTGSYWKGKGVKAFFPAVEIKFVTEGFKGRDMSGVDEKSKHWHVPLLLGPYSYTTYRGS